MRVASYRTEGPFAGQVRELRQVSGPQLWAVVVTLELDNGQVDRHNIEPKERVHLRDLYPIVQKSIDELCDTPQRIVRASMDFMVRGKR